MSGKGSRAAEVLDGEELQGEVSIRFLGASIKFVEERYSKD